jgi:hypothetical protein
VIDQLGENDSNTAGTEKTRAIVLKWLFGPLKLAEDGTDTHCGTSASGKQSWCLTLK